MRILAILVALFAILYFADDIPGLGGMKFASSGSGGAGFSKMSNASRGVTSGATNAARNISK